MIPRIFHRTLPADTGDEVERYWAQFQALHPGWEFRTYREPVDPADWPVTGKLFASCQNGAQRAGLIRLEAVYTWGGIYVDSDVEPVRSFEPLLGVDAFAGWEDSFCVPDAVLGAAPAHPAFETMLRLACESVTDGAGAWASGPGVCTEVLPGRDDVLLLPPGAFYPFHYLTKQGDRSDAGPWPFAIHRFHGSWLTPRQQASLDRRRAQVRRR